MKFMRNGKVLKIHTRKKLLTKKSIYTRGKNICKGLTGKIYICGTDPQKCPFLSQNFAEHVLYALLRR